MDQQTVHRARDGEGHQTLTNVAFPEYDLSRYKSGLRRTRSEIAASRSHTLPKLVFSSELYPSVRP
jgi:hypothetical protein